MICADLVDGCNLKCTLCWNRNRKGTFHSMELETVKRIIHTYGSEERIDWFDWGEPLLHRNFPEVAEIIKDSNSNISSNLSLEVPSNYFKLMQNFKIIYVSLSGMTQDVYKLYHVGGNFDLVMKNIHRLAEQKNTCLACQFLCHKDNIHQFEWAKEYLTGIGFDSVNKVRLNCEVEELIDNFQHPYLRSPRLRPPADRFKCVPFYRVTIGSNGDYLLCCTSHNVKIGGNVFKNMSKRRIRDLKWRNTLCIECRKNNYWRMFS